MYDGTCDGHFQLSQPNLFHVNYVCMGSGVSKKDRQYFYRIDTTFFDLQQ